jgi:hypothetical protein
MRLIFLILTFFYSSVVFGVSDVDIANFTCPAPDADCDGYTTDGTLEGYDCDDTNRKIYAGIPTHEGCSANEFRVCGTDGTYGACKALSSLAASDLSNLGTGINTILWVSPTGVDTSGCGTFANPCSYHCIGFASGLACGSGISSAGTAVVFRGGNYTDTYTYASGGRQVYLRNSGTSSNNNILIAAPEATEAVIQGQGTSGAKITPVDIVVAAYTKIYNLVVDGGYAAAGGITFGSSNYGRVQGCTVRNINGTAGDNIAGIYGSGEPLDFQVIGNTIYDNTDTTNTTNANTSQVVVFKFTNGEFKYNKVYTTGVSTRSSRGIKLKHSTNATSAIIKGNIIGNIDGPCIEYSQPSLTVENNLLSNCNISGTQGGAIRIAGLGGNGYFNGTGYIRNNTIVNSSFVDYAPNTSYAAIGANAYSVTGNVILHDRATAYVNDAQDGFITLGHYQSDAEYPAMVASWDQNSNCYYNDQGTTLFFSQGGSTSGGNNLGANYNGLAAWVAGTTYDDLSFEEDPSLNASYQALSANCADKGWSIYAVASSSAINTWGEDTAVNKWGHSGTSTWGSGDSVNNWGD